MPSRWALRATSSTASRICSPCSCTCSLRGRRSTSSTSTSCARATTRFARSSIPPACTRSEEHTSELQSLTNLVCRLLLEKKNAPVSPAAAQHDRLPPSEIDRIYPRGKPAERHIVHARAGSVPDPLSCGYLVDLHAGGAS